jgi:large conductance mechanosensitive channel
MLKGFKEFLLRGNVIDLAVAVVIGAAFTLVVNSLVKDILTPFIAAIVGKPDFSGLTFTIHHAIFTYGSFLTAAINFVLVAAALYFFVVIPVKRMTELRARKASADGEEATASAPTDEAILLAEIRDLLKTRNIS